MGFVVAAAALMAALHDSWLVKRLEARNLDSIFLLLRERPSDDIRVVEIDRADFHSRFGGVSPLDPGKVADLVRIVDQGGARAIGVDIETDDWPAAFRSSIATRAPVVWVRSVSAENGSEVGPKLGTAGEDVLQGPPTLTQIDGQVGLYRRWIAQPGDTFIPSFTTEILHAAQSTLSASEPVVTREEQTEGERDIPLRVNNALQNRIFTRDLPATPGTPDFIAGRVFDGKIVLIGGGFPESRDAYQTAFGPMYGVQILANIVNAEWSHRNFRRAHPFVMVVTDLVFGLLLVLATYRFAPVTLWRLLCVFVCIALLALAMSVGLYWGFAVYISFVPVVLGVIAHSIFEHVHHHRRLLKQVAAQPQ
jgi:CHASE2 domain-containing sensor protein